MPKEIKTHVFRGKRYKIQTVCESKMPIDTYGICQSPTKKDKKLKIRKGLSELEELEIYLHEQLHCCFWDLDEEAIYESARDMAKFLQRLGYKKEK